MKQSSQPFESHERLAAGHRPEIIGRLHVINAGKGNMQASAMAMYPELAQVPGVEQPTNTVTQLSYEQAPAAGNIINMATYRDQNTAAEVQLLAEIRQEIDRINREAA